MYFKLLWGEFATLPEVEAIALGGSRAGADYDEKSDYDLYIYCASIPDESVRRKILEKHCKYMEIGNSFWELEDDCTLKDGTDIDILYRNIRDFHRQSARSLRNIQPITVIRPACGITCYTAGFSAIKTGNWKSCKISIGFHIRTNCGTILSVKICDC